MILSGSLLSHILSNARPLRNGHWVVEVQKLPVVLLEQARWRKTDPLKACLENLKRVFFFLDIPVRYISARCVDFLED